MTLQGWPISYAGCSDCEELDSLYPSDRAKMEEAAVTFLWNWTGRQFGLRETTLRPCSRNCQEPTWPLSHSVPRWPWMVCGRCGTETCSCTRIESIILPGPVDSVTEVLMDGWPMDPAHYRVDDRRALVRLDGEAWPLCQDMTLDSIGEGTWQVTYLRGVTAPIGGQLAAGALACELAKAFCGSSACQLPQRIQNVTRQGISVTIMDPMEDLDNGRTGVWVIDSWVASVVKSSRGASVRSVDVPRRFRSVP